MADPTNTDASGQAGRLLLGVYRGLSALAAPFVPALLQRRARAGREDAARLGERQGEPALQRPSGPVVWVHAASVGESLSILPLVGRIRAERPGTFVLVTTGTPASAALIAQRLPSGAAHQYVPVDLPGAVHRFLAHWKPSLALWVESEIWPNLLTEARKRGVPVVIVNGRMSPRSFRRWMRLRPLALLLLGTIARVFAQSADDAERFRALGARRVDALANLKAGAELLPVAAAALTDTQRRIGGRPCWVAASTHDGEEIEAIRVHVQLRTRYPGLLTIIAPRHTVRGIAVEQLARGVGLDTALRSAGQMIGPATECYIADTMGELGLWYRLCPVAFLGGSLVPHGGHNPLEAARLGCAVVVGPHTGNFATLTRELEQNGALRRVAAAGELSAAVAAEVGGARRPHVAAGAEALAAAGAAAAEAVLAEVAIHLPSGV